MHDDPLEGISAVDTVSHQGPDVSPIPPLQVRCPAAADTAVWESGTMESVVFVVHLKKDNRPTKTPSASLQRR